MKPVRVAAVILAAGQSRRMGEQNKLLLPYGGKPMLRHCLDQVKKASISDIILVTGHQAENIRRAVGGFSAQFVHNDDYHSGMASSLKVGISAVPKNCDAAVILLGDMPKVTADILQCLIAAFAPDKGQSIIIPTYHGQRGNPLLWGRALFPALDSIGGDRGAKGLLNDYPDHIHEIDVGSEGIFRDVDNPESYSSLISG